MKERYEVPEMEIVEFETEDIITTSGDPETPFVPFSEKVRINSDFSDFRGKKLKNHIFTYPLPF